MGRTGASALRVHQELQRRPLATVGWLVPRTGLSTPTVGKALDTLVREGIAREITGRRRRRVFAYDRYLVLLNEGTERAGAMTLETED
jgi:Fic family protein